MTITFHDLDLRGARTYAELATPIGPLTLVATGGFLSAVLFQAPPAPEQAGAELGRLDPESLAPARTQLAAYFAGERTTFDLPVAVVGSAFRRQVWAALTEIPYGRTASYGEIAAAIGAPGAARAVGLANHHNPVAVVVPCHRVIGSGGALTGYAGGLDRKRWLLAHEAAQTSHDNQLELSLP